MSTKFKFKFSTVLNLVRAAVAVRPVRALHGGMEYICTGTIIELST
eukprot:SAG31_NODE_4709_length_3018_cov_1.639603_2_plen_46_part_00